MVYIIVSLQKQAIPVSKPHRLHYGTSFDPMKVQGKKTAGKHSCQPAACKKMSVLFMQSLLPQISQ